MRRLPGGPSWRAALGRDADDVQLAAARSVADERRAELAVEGGLKIVPVDRQCPTFTLGQEGVTLDAADLDDVLDDHSP